jgi:hypothetical protein
MSKPTPPRNKVVPAKTAKAPRKPDTELLGEGHCTQQAQKNYVERDSWDRNRSLWLGKRSPTRATTRRIPKASHGMTRDCLGKMGRNLDER